jgi:hypothetical protein
MDHETNKQEPSSTEGGEVKIGDKVWVLCEVLEPEYQGCVKCLNHNYVLHPYVDEIRPVEPSNSPKILDSSSEPMRAAFESSMAKRYDWYQGYFSRNENRYFDSSVEMAWQAYRSGAKHGDPSGGWDPTKDEIEYAIDRCGVPASDPLQVGDAVRFVPPGHNRHGTQGVLKSIHHGPKNAYLFVSDCGQFHRYCTIAELERADQADPIDIKGSMASLDGADTIQAGDLQWTDRDSKYRLCNFTIGMRVHEAIQRGKAHGEKWVFYRKFKEVAEASGASDEPAVKRYREPTLADLANGPIACECRGGQIHEWQPQILLDILREAGYPYRASCPKNQHKITRWSQCRIEVGE